jgi:hypothetical protein
VVLSDKNGEVSLRLEPEAQIIGRIVAFEESSLPPFDKLQVFAQSEGRSTAARPVTPDAEGKFVLANLAFPQHTIIVQGLSPQYYVKEIHVNGEALRDDTVTLSAELNRAEIVIDDKPGTIVGTVTDRDQPVGGARVRLFRKAPQSVLPVSALTADSQGKFEIKGLAPGEYRILAQPKATATQPAGAPTDVTYVEAGQPIAVERGGTSNVTLLLTNPIR